MINGPESPIRNLYVHVPFCARKCDYCAFYSEAAQGDIVNRYVDSLIQELKSIATDLRPRTIFFGGGTPSLLNLSQWDRILTAMDRLRLLGADEWTVECNPATVSFDKAKLLLEHGVNRISMGVQSLHDGLLDRLGRVHSREQVFKSFDILRQAGFKNLNVDLMFAIPGQTLEHWRQTLAEAIELQSEHLSSYEVIYEEDTPLFEQLHAGKFDVDEDLACAMYEELVEHAETSGFHQYEIANFAKGGRDHPDSENVIEGHSSLTALRFPGTRATESSNMDELENEVPAQERLRRASSNTPPLFACQHNVNYWRGGSFHGAGPSATSYVRGIRTKNWSNTRLYCEAITDGRNAIESRERLTPLARAGETAAFGLRMTAGWPFSEFQEITGFDLREEWNTNMCELASRDWARISPHRFQLTRTGLRFADAAAELFLR